MVSIDLDKKWHKLTFQQKSKLTANMQYSFYLILFTLTRHHKKQTNVLPIVSKKAYCLIFNIE